MKVFISGIIFELKRRHTQINIFDLKNKCHKDIRNKLLSISYKRCLKSFHIASFSYSAYDWNENIKEG